jgi:glycosyltransferase involved in cell wall biosynthesis
MPTYNRAAFIGAAVASVQQQTYTNWELIIIDDGSDDNTAEIIEQLHDDRISFFKAGRIGIGGKIKNIGLEKATGTLIAFIDSDDLWHELKLAKQVAALQQYPDAGFCLTGGYNFTIPGTASEFFYPQRDGELHANVFTLIFASKIAMFTQALLLRKACLLQSGHFKEEGSFSDFDFIANLAFYHTAVVLYEPLFFRRLHTSNYINTTWQKSYYAGFASILAFKNENKLQPALANDALFRLYIHFGNDAVQHNKKTLAVINFCKAWRYKPFTIVPIKKIMKAIFFFKKAKA